MGKIVGLTKELITERAEEAKKAAEEAKKAGKAAKGDKSPEQIDNGTGKK